jgi:DNA-binding SARP family transcriptional activator
MSTGLHITTFGELTIQNDGKTVISFPSRKAEALLIYLVVEKAAHRRESLLNLL